MHISEYGKLEENFLGKKIIFWVFKNFVSNFLWSGPYEIFLMNVAMHNGVIYIFNVKIYFSNFNHSAGRDLGSVTFIFLNFFDFLPMKFRRVFAGRPVRVGVKRTKLKLFLFLKFI